MKAIAVLCSVLVAMDAVAELDLANLDELKKEERPVSPEILTALIGNANRVVVTESPMLGAKELFESRDKKDLEALSEALVVIKPDKWFHCMCIGTPAIYLYDDEELLAEVTNHHGQSVRCSLWGSDALIADTEKWLEWFDHRKIRGPRKEVDEKRKSDEQSQSDWNKWVTAMPEVLRPIWGNSYGLFGDENMVRLSKALRASIPKKEEQILALLHWHGSGAGSWSGYPAYESAAEDLLLEYEIAEIVSAIEDKKLTVEQTGGAARLLGGWGFSNKHPEGLDQVPAKVKQLLWRYVKGTKDKENIEWARSAFKRK